VHGRYGPLGPLVKRIVYALLAFPSGGVAKLVLEGDPSSNASILHPKIRLFDDDLSSA
jgi:hypothetical protein